MIVIERVQGTENLIRTYSDAAMMIRQDQTGAMYEEAVDIDTSGYTYTETDIPISSEELSDTDALNIIMGRGIIREPEDGGIIPEEN